MKRHIQFIHVRVVNLFCTNKKRWYYSPWISYQADRMYRGLPGTMVYRWSSQQIYSLLPTYQVRLNILYFLIRHQAAYTRGSPLHENMCEKELIWHEPDLKISKQSTLLEKYELQNRWRLRCSAHSPKSASLSSPASLMSRFWGLTSLCSTRRLWQ